MHNGSCKLLVFFLIKSLFILMCVNICLHHTHASCPWRPEEDVGCSGTGEKALL